MRALSTLAFGVCLTVLEPCIATSADSAMNKDTACSILKKRIAKLDSLPESGPVGMGWYCDFATFEDKRWFVIALRSNRQCEGICSNLMGWFAIDRRTGSVHDFDVANLEVGTELRDK